MEEETPGIWIAREYLPATLIDLSHLGVEVPSGYLSKPTRLQLEARTPGNRSVVPIGSQVGGGFDFTTIYVMSKDRPVFSEMEPSAVESDRVAEVMVRILGSGFSGESEVLTSFQVGIGHAVNALKPVFVSDSELQLLIPSYLLRAGSSNAESLKLWVRNGDDQHVSDAQFLSLLASAAPHPARARQARVTSISPYPFPLMDFRSPDDC